MQESYTTVLQQSFQTRVKQNPRYSMRSFARDIGLAPSTLSEILKGKKGLSPSKAVTVGEALRLPDWQLNRFQRLVAKDYSRTKTTNVVEADSADKAMPNISQIKPEAAKSLTSWLDLAILEATHLKDFEPSESWLSQKFSVSECSVSKSCEALLSSGLLKINEANEWIDCLPFFTTSDGVPSAAIRSYHQSVLQLMSSKIDSEPVENRTAKSVVFSLEKDDLTLAAGILDEAVAKILALADKSKGPKDHVVCFGSFLFKMTKEES